jgi:hypothetical protein
MKQLRWLFVPLFVLGLSAAFSALHAQEFSLSVSGKSSSGLSGAARNYFDYWIKPHAGTRSAAIRIYDASILPQTGDVIYGKIDTKTSFELFRFSDLYAFSDKRLTPKPADEAKPLASLSVLDEEQYRKRWTLFAQVEPDSLGYIVRVRASEGNDVNAFKLAATDLNEPSLQSDQWDLIGIDLSIGTISLPANYEVQLKPYFDDEPPPALNVEGEEGATIALKDVLATRCRWQTQCRCGSLSFQAKRITGDFRFRAHGSTTTSLWWASKHLCCGICAPMSRQFNRRPKFPFCNCRATPAMKCVSHLAKNASPILRLKHLLGLRNCPTAKNALPAIRL